MVKRMWPKICRATACWGVPVCALTVRALLVRAKGQPGVRNRRAVHRCQDNNTSMAQGASGARSCSGHVGCTCVARSKATASSPISSSTEVLRRRLLEPRIGEQRRCCYLAGAFAHIHVPRRPRNGCTQLEGYNVLLQGVQVAARSQMMSEGVPGWQGHETKVATIVYALQHNHPFWIVSTQLLSLAVAPVARGSTVQNNPKGRVLSCAAQACVDSGSSGHPTPC